MQEHAIQGGGGFDTLDSKLESVSTEIRELQTAVGDFGRSEGRLKRLEELVEDIGSMNEIILESVRSFEAIISVNLVKKVNELIEERLTVISGLEARRRSQGHRINASLVVNLVLLVALIAEVKDGTISQLFYQTRSVILPVGVGLGDWIVHAGGW